MGVEVHRPEFTTPAMIALVEAVEETCEFEPVKKHLGFAFSYLNFLNSLVNSNATMTKEQAGVVSYWLVDHHLSAEPFPDYPKLPDLLPLATYINSCKV